MAWSSSPWRACCTAHARSPCTSAPALAAVAAALRESSQRNGGGQWSILLSHHPSARGHPGNAGVEDPRALDLAHRGGNRRAGQAQRASTRPARTNPTGGDAIDIPAGSANRYRSWPRVLGAVGAVAITSTVPGHRGRSPLPAGPAGASGVMTVAAPALQEQGVLADAGQRADTTTLVLLAPGTGRAGPAHHGLERPDLQRLPGRQHRQRRRRRGWARRPRHQSSGIGPVSPHATVKITAPRGLHWGQASPWC